MGGKCATVSYNNKMIIRYDKNEQVVAIGDNCHDLARKLNITPQAVSHGLHRGSKLYYRLEDNYNEETGKEK